MRRILLTTLYGTAVMATLALFATPADAADMRCRVPFSFEVRGQTLPPRRVHVQHRAGKPLGARLRPHRGGDDARAVLHMGHRREGRLRARW